MAARSDRRTGRGWELSLLLPGKSAARGYRHEVPENEARSVPVRHLHRCDSAGDPSLVGHAGVVRRLSGAAYRPRGRRHGVAAYQDDMLIAILPMYVPMVLFIGIHFVMLLTGKTRYPRWMLAFHPVTWNILLAVIPDIVQAMQVPAVTWMSVMSQSSTNTAIVIWCAAAAIYGKRHSISGFPA